MAEAVKHCKRQSPFADWLLHECRGHNALAEAIVLYGLDSTEAWNFCVTHHGITKTQAMRRRLMEARDAFANKRR